MPPTPGKAVHTAKRGLLRQWECRCAVGLELAFRGPESRTIAACATADGAEMDEALGDHWRAHREADMRLEFWSCAALCAFRSQRVWTECGFFSFPPCSNSRKHRGGPPREAVHSSSPLPWAVYRRCDGVPDGRLRRILLPTILPTRQDVGGSTARATAAAERAILAARSEGRFGGHASPGTGRL